MFRTPSVALWLPALFLVFCSCTHNPRMVSGTENDYLLRLRAEYFASNPDGVYNDFIRRGEVVKGMDLLEVLAAWGHPKTREKRSPSTEQWFYLSVDEQSKDWFEYTFIFRDGILSDWELTRNLAAGGRVELPDRDGVLTKGVVAAGDQADAPKK